MKSEKDPVVVDLAERRKAAEQAKLAAARKAKSKRTPSSEPLLGLRPRAGLILAAVAIILLMLWLAPVFF